MLSSTNAIVLSTIKYSESHLIVTCYTKEFGIVSFLLKGILKRNKKKIKAAHFQLLTQLQLQINYKNNRSLQIITEVKLNYVYASLHTNISKSAIVMFLSEVLVSVLREEESNTLLYAYLETTLQWLDTQDTYSNFHLLFLLKLTKHLGFYPQTNNGQFDFFNLKAGRFEKKPTDIYAVSGENLTLLKQLLGTNFDTLNMLKLNAKQRQAFLSMLLLYFELHLGNFKKPKSLTILNQVFNA